MAKKQLTKSRDKVMSGVLGGFAEYFSIDATLLRIIFATAAVFFFPLVVLYFIFYFPPCFLCGGRAIIAVPPDVVLSGGAPWPVWYTGQGIF